MKLRTISFLGLKLHPYTMAESIDACERLIEKRDQQHVVLNASKTVLAQDDPELAAVINKCGLINADGQSVVTGGRLLGLNIPERVAGIDLMRELLDRAPQRKWRVYLLGAHEDTLIEVVNQLTAEGVNVVGARNGYWDPAEEETVISHIAKSKSDLLFVAMPSPRKEFFLERNLLKLETGLAFGVGGSFDVMAGKTKRAPLWMQRLGLEWFFRFWQEPRRMFKRYLVGNSRFMFLVVREKLKK